MLILIGRQDENLVYAGSKKTIEYAITAKGTMPAMEFFYGLSPVEQRKLYVLYQVLGDTGRILNREHFKKVERTDFFEFKRFNIRVICYLEPGNKVILTHGFIKKRDKIPSEEIKRAIRIKEEYSSLKKRLK